MVIKKSPKTNAIFKFFTFLSIQVYGRFRLYIDIDSTKSLKGGDIIA